MAHLIGLVVRAARTAPARLRPRTVARAWLTAGAAMVAVTAVATPALAGGLATPGSVKEVPGYWHEAADWLDANTGRGRVLVVPGARFPSYDWGSTTDEITQPLLTSRWAVRNAIPFTPPATIRLLDVIESRLATGAGSTGLADLLARSGISHVLFRADLDHGRSDTARPAVVRQALDRSPGLTRVTSFGPLRGGPSSSDEFRDQGLDVPVRALEVYRVDRPVQPVVAYDSADVTTVVGGPESLLDLAAAGQLGAAPTVLAGDAATAGVAGPVAMTDGLRRRDVSFGRLRDNASQTLTADDTFEVTAPAHDYLPEWGRGGPPSPVSRASARSARRPPARRWTRRAAPAPNTSRTRRWTATRDLLAVRAVLAQRPSVGHCGPRQPDPGHPGRGVVRPEGRRPAHHCHRQRRIREPDRRTVQRSHGLRTARRARHPRDPGLGRRRVRPPSARQRIGGHRRDQDSRCPDQPDPRPSRRAVHRPAGDRRGVGGTHHSGLLHRRRAPALLHRRRSWFRGRVHHRPDPDPAGRRGVRRQLWARPTAGPELDKALDKLVADAQPLRLAAQVSASSTAVADPTGRAGAALDGDPATSWSPAVDDEAPILRLKWLKPQTITGLRLSVDDGTAATRLGSVRVVGDDGFRSSLLGDDGLLRLDPPMRTDEITIQFLDKPSATSTDPYKLRLPEQLPIAVGEVTVLPGAPTVGPRLDVPLTLACGSGPTLRLGAARVTTSLRGTLRDLLEMREMPVTPCGRATLGSSTWPGEHRLVATPSQLASPTMVALVPRTPTPAPAATASAIGIDSWEATERRVRVTGHPSTGCSPSGRTPTPAGRRPSAGRR
ncbi:alpha-(1-_3)-arabinofuranosyltransferase family protein [Micromonospora sp. M12]